MIHAILEVNDWYTVKLYKCRFFRAINSRCTSHQWHLYLLSAKKQIRKIFVEIILELKNKRYCNMLTRGSSHFTINASKKRLFLERRTYHEWLPTTAHSHYYHTTCTRCTWYYRWHIDVSKINLKRPFLSKYSVTKDFFWRSLNEQIFYFYTKRFKIQKHKRYRKFQLMKTNYKNVDET